MGIGSQYLVLPYQMAEAGLQRTTKMETVVVEILAIKTEEACQVCRQRKLKVRPSIGLFRVNC